MSVKKCFSCGKSASEISLLICGHYLCPGCEKRLTRSQVGMDDYQHWINSCRKLWEDLETQSGAGKN